MNENVFKVSGLEDWLNTLSDEERKEELKEIIFSDDFTDIYGKTLGVYDFEEGKGISGILLGNGHFLKCTQFQHGLLSSILNEEEKFLAIYFSSRLHKEDDSVYTHHLKNSLVKNDIYLTKEKLLLKMNVHNEYEDGKIIITDKQLEFVKNHIQYLNTSQKWMLLDLFENEEVQDMEKIDTDFYFVIQHP